MRITTLLLTLLLLATTAAADLITPQTSATRILIPVAGDTPGANGTYFRSDISLINLRNQEQRVMLRWLPQGSSGEGLPTRVITMGARSGITSEDFVRNVMQQTGLGGIEIIALTSDGFLDQQAQLHASARIWTPQPNATTGTQSQTFPAVQFNSQTVLTKWILGVRRDADYRLNVGVMNATEDPQRYRITILSAVAGAPAETLEIDVPSMSILQRAFPGTSPVAQVIVQNISTSASMPWHAWSSSIDNVTGDAWSQMAFPAPPAQ